MTTTYEPSYRERDVIRARVQRHVDMKGVREINFRKWIDEFDFLTPEQKEWAKRHLTISIIVNLHEENLP
jgi:hypothetical protein